MRDDIKRDILKKKKERNRRREKEKDSMYAKLNCLK